MVRAQSAIGVERTAHRKHGSKDCFQYFRVLRLIVTSLHFKRFEVMVDSLSEAHLALDRPWMMTAEKWESKHGLFYAGTFISVNPEADL